ncbi:putative nucleotide sugar epimerase/dehydratase [Methanocella paludicola SANAE]|uniref:Nucleotide sugar epimerase/dehydratase n=1 Tax=Methanocella paludicola (strain DSM 17711 / JCM 13418 / NBRC 101707 / SANAE) TaxID=304371 RepID=D1Z270_METPS|nr:UDP-glucuronic acid decarboxylase family protein [Methanocella paludicola]BAI62792.1 putative nucleotide sugar epimerase/dehydratase [Methanocella paludicola SANAE]
MPTSVVTGGAGFIGSHLCEYLLGKGDRVIAIDNLGSGSKDNIKGILNNASFTFIKHDVRKPLKVREKVDYVYNLASRASPVDFDRYPVEIMMTNSVGTYNAVNAALEHGARFLTASTSETYGDPDVSPQPETYWGHVNPVGPRSCYDESKRFSEALTMAFVRHQGLDGRIIRIFNTYGPRMRLDDGRVVPNFVTQALAGRPLTVYGDGSQTRSFCYVSDLVRGIYLMMHSPVKGQVVNLGNPREMTVLEFARTIIEKTGSSSAIDYRPLPENDPLQRRPDIRKAKELLGWEPEVGLDEGLESTIAWFKDSMSKKKEKKR